MSRVLMLIAFVGTLAAAEAPAGPAIAARTAAEEQLAQARTRIAAEQAELLKGLHAAVAAGTAARTRLTTAEREAKTASDDLRKRQQEQAQELALVRQIADRAVIAARLGDAETRALAGTPPMARVAAAIAGVNARLAALPARLALRLGDESIVGRDGAVVRTPVLRLGEARAIALGADDSHRGLIERAADASSWRVIGPTLPASVRPAGATATLIPLDANGTAAHQPPAVHRTLKEWLAAGRAFIWPIIAVFVLGVAIVIERLVALARRRVDPRRLVQVAARLAERDAAGAQALVAAGSGPLDRVLRAGLDAGDKPRAAREAVVEQALIAETGQLTRGLPAIAVLAGVAPLLGLLGTVTGMIDMFSVIAAQGSGNAKSLSGGISEALICTQAGMLAAIPLLLAHAWLGRLADRRSQVLEEAACGILGLSEHGDGTAALERRAAAVAS
jgi:biopolymer transport protein ExbB